MANSVTYFEKKKNIFTQKWFETASIMNEEFLKGNENTAVTPADVHALLS